ncbi:MAG: DNA replication and repair protein RecF [Bacteroidaceae bacterium]|nr:DNA replication and repair protein RecF [Bacteroidaceae bacterium]
MLLEHLFVQDYRNIIQADLEFSHKLNCFVGKNGMGKTNLLDAVYCLSFCRSSISQTDQLTVRHGAECYQLQGSYILPSGDKTVIGCISRPKGHKQIKRDGKEYQRFSDHIGYIPLVMVSPQDTELISGGSDERRRFMDIIISQYDSDYLKQLISYNKALSQRNVLLKMEKEPDAELFLMWEQIMADTGQKIYQRRKALTDKLVPYFSEMYSLIGDSSEQVSLSYTSHAERGDLLAQLEEGRGLDRKAGYSLHGIHKDELEMNLDGFPIRREGSQGQNKSYLVALKLAQYRLLKESCGKRPILLLDDIFDRLDAVRVGRIISLVSDDDKFGQVFITDVDRNHIDGILEGSGCDYKVFTVQDGEVI